ncbi:MAG: hypothetical protein WEB88_04170 [Gemmatimonadota bacterium]
MLAEPQPLERLRANLERILGNGMVADPIAHASQVADVAAVLHEAFASRGFLVTLVGGSAIEIHAPGIYRSGDLDVVLEATQEATHLREEIFLGLGFRHAGRHWRHGSDLFVELVNGPVAGPTEDVRVGDAEFRIVTKEVVLRDRLVGFKHWKYTAYGEQAVDMLAAFGSELDPTWLLPELEREDALDALEALQQLARSSKPITDQLLRGMIDELHDRERNR